MPEAAAPAPEVAAPAAAAPAPTPTPAATPAPTAAARPAPTPSRAAPQRRAPVDDIMSRRELQEKLLREAEESRGDKARKGVIEGLAKIETPPES